VLQFYAVLPDFELRHLHVEQGIQAELTSKFRREAAAFLQGKEVIEFEPGYARAERGEVLVTRSFPLPERFKEDVRDSNHCEDINPQDLSHRNVKAVVGATARDEDGAVDIAVFKEMSGARILDQRAFSFVLDGNTLNRIDRPGLVIPEPVHAVYEGGDLYFSSFETTRRFVDLTEIYSEASHADIEEFLSSGPVAFEGDGTIHDVVDTWSRRRISMILESHVWEQITVPEICAQAAAFGVTVETKDGGGTLVLKADRAYLKDVLKVLNQDLFHSILTNTPMYAGTKVRLEP
jgi:hypothetical protein